jgi:hypothetical protein
MILVNHVDTRFFQLNHFYLKKKKNQQLFFLHENQTTEK